MGPEYAGNKPPDLETAVESYLKSGNQSDRGKVIKIGQELIKYYAGVYSPGMVDERLKKAATEGFMQALKNFDPSKRVLFTTYATHCIISEIRQELRERNLFRVPDWLQRLQEEVVRATEELAGENSPLPTLQDIAEKVNIAEEGIVEAMQAGSVSLKDLDLTALKSLRHETFKLPIEDAVTIRKSLDRLQDIQQKVLSLISVNLKELILAMEEEELALTKTQAGYIKMVDDGSVITGEEEAIGFKIDFPEQCLEEEVERYFEVLSDEFGLRLVELKLKGPLKPEDEHFESIPVRLNMEGRYRCLVRFLNHLRKEERYVRVDRVRTDRNDRIPARISTFIDLKTYYRLI